jgi:hypothetical protein
MSEHFQRDPKLDSDPIIDELHEIRAKLEEKHQGDFHLYSMAARAHAIKLGFKFIDLQVSDES